MRILGIDPGLEITGYAVIEMKDSATSVLEAGVIRSNTKLRLENRLLQLATELRSVLDQLEPDVVSIEELYSHYAHPRTAIVMGHARGIAYLLAAQNGLPVYSYAATRIKKSLTGNGRATKQQMQQMVATVLNLPEIPRPPDTADALAVALCHGRAIEHGSGVPS